MKKYKNTKKQKGFVVLFTALIASIMLLLAIGISNVALKEAVLSNSSRDAHVAFFSADTGSDCALFLDLKKGVFTNFEESPGPFYCADQELSITESQGDFGDFTRRFSFEFATNTNGDCARVIVDKIPLFPNARIESLGYNVSCDEITGDNNLLIERAVRVQY